MTALLLILLSAAALGLIGYRHYRLAERLAARTVLDLLSGCWNVQGQVIPMSADQWIVEDLSEYAMHRIIDIAGEFEHAIAMAETGARCVQLSERIGVAIALLQDAQNAALKKADRVSP